MKSKGIIQKIYQKASILTGLGNTETSHIKLVQLLGLLPPLHLGVRARHINSCRPKGPKSIANSISFITLLFLFMFGILLRANSIQANSVSVKTEFDHQPRKIIPFFFGSLNFRGRDYMSGGEFAKAVGGGAGFLYNINIDPMWRGHKFLYSYLDVEVQQEMNSARIEETWRPILVINPGVMVRSFIPFVKIFYGTGLSLRLGNSDFEKWGIFGQFGLEYRGIFLSARIVGSPGEGNIYNELRAGYMFVPSKKSWRR